MDKMQIIPDSKIRDDESLNKDNVCVKPVVVRETFSDLLKGAGAALVLGFCFGFVFEKSRVFEVASIRGKDLEKVLKRSVSHQPYEPPLELQAQGCSPLYTTTPTTTIQHRRGIDPILGIACRRATSLFYFKVRQMEGDC